MADIERLEIMDSQRFDASKRRTNRMNLSIQTGLSDEETTSLSSRSSSPVVSTPEGSWDSFAFARDSSPELSDSASDSRQSGPSTPPTSLDSSLNSSLVLGDDAKTKVLRQTDVFDKGAFVTTRTIIRPIPRSPIPRCFSRPSSPVTSRPSSPLRPRSPLNFGALNCFSNADAFTEQVDYLQVQRARELEGLADAKVHVHQIITTDSEVELPWIVQKVVDPEGLRRRAMEPRGVVSSP
ncbi:hypothetical protein MVEN_00593400 [Mycena venus]|uniref:Uncharacterized protein n=1 Tax=Mycena venus TaxID=2733690 RepID=A0A8H7D875_9AGAR|nr:hypothetical protein MVEN_00593400 [Mycena venus]